MSKSIRSSLLQKLRFRRKRRSRGQGNGRLSVLSRRGVIECLEDRRLLAGDLGASLTLVLDGGDFLPQEDAPEGEGARVAFFVDLTDLSGNSITEVAAGDQFQAKVSVQDVRQGITDDLGVFNPWVDLSFDAGLAAIADFTATGATSVPDSVVFGPDYRAFARVDAIAPGVLDEVGGVQTDFAIPPATSLGGDPVLFFTATFTASTPGSVAVNDALSVAAGTTGNVLDVLANDELRGTLQFTTNAANDTGANGAAIAGHDVLLLDTTNEGLASEVAPSDIIFNSDSVDVTSAATPTITTVGAGDNGGTITVAADGKSLLYTPASGFTGTETFSYTIDNGEGETAQATVEMTVAAAPDKVAFAKALAAAGVKFFSSASCPFCTQQKQLFEDGAQFLPSIEVTNPDGSLNQTGTDENIQSFPTWEFPDNSRVVGVQTLEVLSQRSGVAIPSSNNPFVAPLSDVTVLAGAPLHVALDGYDPNGDPLTYTVSSSNTSVVQAVLSPAANRSLRLVVERYGDMVFQLFDDLVPGVTNAIASLANSNVYDNTIFHRIINDFVIQGGDPTGTGFGDPALPKFDDEFNALLQHVQTGLLSMAKAGDDTNSSQFFITEENDSLPQQLRSLDFNHSVFGFMTEGELIRAAISDAPTGAQDRPSPEVKLTSAEIFVDQENGVLRLVAPEGATGNSVITVTATDSDGNQFQQTFNVTVAQDPFNGGPYLSPVDPISTSVNTPVTFQLVGNDVENDPITYAASVSGSTTFDFTVNAATGEVTVTPPTDFTGTLELLVGVSATNGSDTGDTFDTQVLEITVGGAAPASVDLLAGSDSGVSDADNITNLTTLGFQVSGVQSGAVVTLFAGATEVGSATASGSTVVINTTNAAAFTDGVHAITARQTIGGAQSGPSAALSVTIDTTAPAAFTSTPPTEIPGGAAIDYNAQNPDEPNVIYSLTNAPAGLTIAAATGVLSWTPTVAQVGSQSFDIVGSDAAGNSVTQNVSLTVLASLPASADTYAATEEQVLTVNAANGVLANDNNNDPTGLTASLVASPTGGQLTFNADGSFTYTPNANFAGADTFTYQATDGTTTSNAATVTINVANVNDSLTGADDAFTTDEDVALVDNVLTNEDANNVDVGETLTATLVTGPTNGQLTLNADGAFTYTPNAEFSGSDSFTYRAADAEFQADVSTVTITINAVNDPPVAQDDSYSVSEDTTLTVDVASGVLANDNDVDDDNATLNALLVTQPVNGTLNFNASNGSFTYTPNANFAGVDQFSYVPNDNTINGETATVSITVAGIADPPTAVDDNFIAIRKSASRELAVLANDTTEPDGLQTMTITSVSTPSNGGTVSITSDNLRLLYTPPTDFIGNETFTYTITDADNLTDTATVTIEVRDAGSLAGFVYLDANANGVKDAGETGLGGVLVTLQGTDAANTDVSNTATTDAAGAYRFEGLALGTYTLTETQPAFIRDGVASVGSQGGTAGVNVLTVDVGENTVGVDNNFGELGRSVSTYSIIDFLVSTPADSFITAVSATGGWFDFASGWDGFTAVSATLPTGQSVVDFEVVDSSQSRFTGAANDNFLVLADDGTSQIVRVFGDSSARTLTPVASGEGEAAPVVATANSGAQNTIAEGEAVSQVVVIPQTATLNTGELILFSVLDTASLPNTAPQLADNNNSQDLQVQLVSTESNREQLIDAVMLEEADFLALSRNTYQGRVQPADAVDADYALVVDVIFEELGLL